MLSDRDRQLVRLVESAGIASRSEIDRALAAGSLGENEDVCARLARFGLLRGDQVDWARISIARGWTPPPTKTPASQSFVPTINPDEISDVAINFQAPIPDQLTQSELHEDQSEAFFIETQEFPMFEAPGLANSQEERSPHSLLPTHSPIEVKQHRVPPNPPTEPLPGLQLPPKPLEEASEVAESLRASEAIEEAPAEGGPRRRRTTASGLEIGPYRLGERLGEGGMGIVYKAYHTVLKSEIALKMILAKGSIDQRALERFEVEAQTMARLQHPNIVRVRDVKLDGRLVYMAMDLVIGENLKEYLKKHTTMPAREAARLGLKIADALQHAHEQGVVHRDLKPANIILTEDGLEPILTDFGLAKPLFGDVERDLTGSNDIVGTPYYVAPEQLDQSRPVDARSDVYSLAATLFEVLTGAPPFASHSSLAVMTQVVTTEAPLLRERLPDAPRPLEIILARCLAKNPDQRYPSAGALTEDLHRFLNDKPILAQPVNVAERAQLWTRRNRRNLVLTVATFLGALLLFWTASVFIQARDAAERLRDRESVEKLLVETEAMRKASEEGRIELQGRLVTVEKERDAARRQAEEALERAASSESARRREALAAIRGRLAEIRRSLSEERWDAAAAIAARVLRDLDEAPISETQARALRSEQGALARQAFRRGGWLWRSPSLLSGEGLSLCSAPAAGFLAAASGRRISLWREPSGAPLASFDPGIGPLTAAAIGPKGRFIAAGAGEGRLAVLDRTGERPLKLRLGDRDIADLAFSSDGLSIAACGEDGQLRLWSLPDGKLLKELKRETRSPLRRLAFAPSARRLAVASADRSILLWDWDSDERRLLRGHESPITGIAYAPDGARLASCSASGFLRVWDLATDREFKIVKVPGAGLSGVAFASDGLSLAAAGADGAVLILSLKDKDATVLGRHEGPTRAVAFLADQSLASLNREGQIIIWDLKKKRSERRLQGHDGPLHGVTFTRSGDRILSASERGITHVWSVKTGTRVQTIRANGIQRSFALSRDDKSLACGFEDGRVAFFSVLRGGRLGGDRPHKNAVLALAYASRGPLLVSGDRDGKIAYWNAELKRSERIVQSHNQAVSALAISPDGRAVASGSTDGAVRLWDPRTGRQIGQEFVLDKAIVDLSFGPKGARLFVAGERLIRVYDWARSKALFEFIPGPNPITCLAIDPRGQTIASGARDASIRLWDAEDGRRLDRFFGHNAAITSLAFSPDGAGLASASVDRTARRWKVRRPRSQRAFRGHSSPIVDLELTGKGRLIATRSADGGFRFWDPRTGLEAMPQRSFADDAQAAVLGEGEIIVAQDRSLQRIDARSGNRQIRYQDARRPVTCIAVSENGALFACGESAGGLELWPLDGRDKTRPLGGHSGRLESVTFSPDGLKLASACDSGLVYIWETASGRRLTGLVLQAGRRIRALKFSADASRLYLAANDGSVESWDWLRTGEKRRLGGHAAAVRSLALSNDGRVLASGSADGEIRLWDLKQAFAIARWSGHESEVTGLAFLGQTARLVSAGRDKLARIWDLYDFLTPSPLEARANEPEALEALGGRRLDGAQLRPSSSARLLLYRQ